MVHMVLAAMLACSGSTPSGSEDSNGGSPTDSESDDTAGSDTGEEPAGACGDGVVAQGEVCDAGNAVAGALCSYECTTSAEVHTYTGECRVVCG